MIKSPTWIFVGVATLLVVLIVAFYTASIPPTTTAIEENLENSPLVDSTTGNNNNNRNQKSHMNNNHKSKKDRQPSKLSQGSNNQEEGKCVIHLVVVVCVERVLEAFLLFKSTLMTLTSPCSVHGHIFIEEASRDRLAKELSTLPRSQFTFELYPLKFPAPSWKQLFKVCASQRLFLPDLLPPEIERVIYLDLDILLLSDLGVLWGNFEKFDGHQLAAMVNETENVQTDWYPRHARHPYYGTFGLNSGVMLMDLKRMRAVDWSNTMKQIFEEYQEAITWGDQDILNIYFAKHPEQVLDSIGCEFNYRPDHCGYGNICKRAEVSGIKLLHGNRRAFFDDPSAHPFNRRPTFRLLSEAIAKYEFATSGSLSDIAHSYLKTVAEVGKADTCLPSAEFFVKSLLTTS